MHRFYLPPTECQGPEILLSPRESHHAAQVLRLRAKDEAIVLDGAGRQLKCVVRGVSKKEVILSVLEENKTPRPACSMTFVQGLPKGKTMDGIVQKATELGVARIVPLLSERAVPHLEGERLEEKQTKWQQTAIEAIKQCGQPWLPEVTLPQTLPVALETTAQSELQLVGSLQAGSRHPRDCFNQFRSHHHRKPQDICLWVGPEGDFSTPELEQLHAANVLPIAFGPLVLRSDTAALYGLSVLNYELQSH